MGLGLHDYFTPLAIADVICVSAASFITIIRLYIRRSRLWWDDGFAFLCMILLIIQMVFYFVHFVNPEALSYAHKISTYYALPVDFYFIIWSARISILFSLLRIEPHPDRQKRIVAVIVGFALAPPLLIVQLFLVCERHSGWKHLSSTPQCDLGRGIAITQLVTDIVADLILCVLPLQLFMAIQEPATRHRLIIIFSTCIATSIVSLVHAAYIMEGQHRPVFISAVVENGVSLAVCSLPVVLTAALRFNTSTEVESSGGDRRTGRSSLRFSAARGRSGATGTGLSESTQISSTVKERDLERSGGSTGLTSFGGEHVATVALPGTRPSEDGAMSGDAHESKDKEKAAAP